MNKMPERLQQLSKILMLIRLTAFTFLHLRQEGLVAFVEAIDVKTVVDRTSSRRENLLQDDRKAKNLEAGSAHHEFGKDDNDEAPGPAAVSCATSSSSCKKNSPEHQVQLADHAEQVSSSSSFLFFASQNGQTKSKKFLQRRENDEPASMFQYALDFAGAVGDVFGTTGEQGQGADVIEAGQADIKTTSNGFLLNEEHQNVENHNKQNEISEQDSSASADDKSTMFLEVDVARKMTKQKKNKKKAMPAAGGGGAGTTSTPAQQQQNGDQGNNPQQQQNNDPKKRNELEDRVVESISDGMTGSAIAGVVLLVFAGIMGCALILMVAYCVYRGCGYNWPSDSENATLVAAPGNHVAGEGSAATHDQGDALSFQDDHIQAHGQHK
ncbi:unnamed protein product [Amoebophrya sp. A120]|nr:unnamed protein product [Amoebophrya sp. A120]|eukprot:GSA120T00025198001.1